MSADFDDGKDDGALRTIGEVSKALGIKSHILRYWEEQFPMLEPLKRSGGRRYYRPADIIVIERISHLVNDEGYTLKGARQALENGKTEPDESDQQHPEKAEVMSNPPIDSAPIERAPVDCQSNDDAASPLELTVSMADNGGVNEFFGRAAGGTSEEQAEPAPEGGASSEDGADKDGDTVSRADIVARLKAVRVQLADALAV